MPKPWIVIGALLLLAYLTQGAHYIYRTSFIADERVFTLWDDGMISMRYARNLAEGEGLIWNADGERVQGFSNLGLTLLMAVMHLLPVRPEKIPLLVQLAQLGVLAGILVFVYRLARLLFPRERCVGAAAAAATGLYAPLSIWSLQGSEHGALTLIVLASLWGLAAGRGRAAPVRWPFLLLGLGVVIRLDFAITYCVILICHVAMERRRAPAVFGALVLAGVVASLVTFSLAYYGDPLPNTYYLKSTGAPLGLVLRTGWEHAGKFLFPGGLVIPSVLFLIGAALCVRKDPFFLPITVLVPVTFAYTVWTGGDWVWMHSNRFALTAMPLFLLTLVGGTSIAASRIPRAPRQWTVPLLALAVVPACAWALNPAKSMQEWFSIHHSPMYHEENRIHYRNARTLCEQTRPDTTIGVFWAGLLPYHCDREVVDLLGRSDRHIARLPMNAGLLRRGRFNPGHSKWDWNYVIHWKKVDVLTTDNPELRGRRDFRNRYCRARGPIRFVVRKEAIPKIPRTFATCAVDSPRGGCRPC